MTQECRVETVRGSKALSVVGENKEIEIEFENAFDEK